MELVSNYLGYLFVIVDLIRVTTNAESTAFLQRWGEISGTLQMPSDWLISATLANAAVNVLSLPLS